MVQPWAYAAIRKARYMPNLLPHLKTKHERHPNFRVPGPRGDHAGTTPDNQLSTPDNQLSTQDHAHFPTFTAFSGWASYRHASVPQLSLRSHRALLHAFLTCLALHGITALHRMWAYTVPAPSQLSETPGSLQGSPCARTARVLPLRRTPTYLKPHLLHEDFKLWQRLLRLMGSAGSRRLACRSTILGVHGPQRC